jgi:hypothetical protein
MKTYILYHGHCYDGYGAAFAAWLRYQDNATYIPVSYGQLMPQIDNDSDVFILDFSYPREALKELARRTFSLVVLDHHQTAEKDLTGLQEEIADEFYKTERGKELPGSPYLIRFDMNKSGAVLACEFFHGDSIKCEVGQLGEFFAYLQDRDLWKFELPMSREVSMALRSYPFDFKTWSDLSGIVVSGQIYEAPGICMDRLKKEGVACRRLTEQQVEIMAKNARIALFDLTGTPQIVFGANGTKAMTHGEKTWAVPVANATVFFSEVGEKLLELHPEAPFSAYYMDRRDGHRQWGFRSRPDFDCSVVAKAFGGGGHRCASGFVQKL